MSKKKVKLHHKHHSKHHTHQHMTNFHLALVGIVAILVVVILFLFTGTDDVDLELELVDEVVEIEEGIEGDLVGFAANPVKLCEKRQNKVYRYYVIWEKLRDRSQDQTLSISKRNKYRNSFQKFQDKTYQPALDTARSDCREIGYTVLLVPPPEPEPEPEADDSDTDGEDESDTDTSADLTGTTETTETSGTKLCAKDSIKLHDCNSNGCAVSVCADDEKSWGRLTRLPVTD